MDILQTRETDINSPYYFAKVRKNSTVFMEWNKRNIEMHHGIYIDIFPYDNVPDDKNERNKFYKQCNFLLQLFILRTTPDRHDISDKNIKWYFISTIRKTLHKISKTIPSSWFYSLLDKN